MLLLLLSLLLLVLTCVWRVDSEPPVLCCCRLTRPGSCHPQLQQEQQTNMQA